MNAKKAKHSDIRTFGAVWLLLAPLLFVMAGISTVRSNVTYWVQLAGFSLVALAGASLGLAALFRLSWAASGLRVLSWLGAAYFFGAALLILIWPLVPGSEARFGGLLVLVPLLVAPFGIPFLLMARALGAIVKTQRDECRRDEG